MIQIEVTTKEVNTAISFLALVVLLTFLIVLVTGHINMGIAAILFLCGMILLAAKVFIVLTFRNTTKDPA